MAVATKASHGAQFGILHLPFPLPAGAGKETSAGDQAGDQTGDAGVAAAATAAAEPPRGAAGGAPDDERPQADRGPNDQVTRS